MRPTTFLAFLAGLYIAVCLMQIDQRHREAIETQRAQIAHCDKGDKLVQH